METNSIDGIIKQLDYYELWYKWMKKHCPNPKEMYKFDTMNKQQQYNYLKEKLNEDN